MKHSILLFLCLLATLTACENEHIGMNTIIREDGSCSRVVTFKADSMSLAQGHVGELSNILGILDHDIWQCEIYDTTWVRAQRDFATLDEMAYAIPLQIAGQQIRSKATLEKHFRWFYNDYVFTETFESIAPIFKIPLSNYMDEETANYWLTGSPDILKGFSGMERKDYLDQMEGKFMQFVNANILNDLMDVLGENYDSIPKPPMDKEEFIGRKMDMIEHIDRIQGSILDFDVEKYLTEVMGTETYIIALKENPTIAQAWEQRQGVYVSALTLDVDYQLTLPGGIIKINECGDGVFRDGELHYRLDGMRLLSPGYTIRATSSGKNNWSMFLTLLIVIFAVTMIVWTRRKKSDKEE